MAADERSARARHTANLLHELLLTRSEYYKQWQEQTQRHRSAGVSKAGVARVIALYLWGSGERADNETTLARDLKDRIRRALAGEALSSETLTWFLRAFEMNAQDEQLLWATYANDRESQLEGISNTITTFRELAQPQRHRTIALFERYTIGPDRQLSERQTMHTIMALEDCVDTYPFTHEADVHRIEVIHGGSLGRPYLHGDGLHTDLLVLEQVLRKGWTAALEYRTAYPSGIRRRTEVRRAAHGRSENIDMALQFHPSVLPRSVWWAVWPDHYEGDPVSEELAVVNNQGSVRRFVRFIEETVVGFRWEW